MGLEIRRIRVVNGANVFALFPIVYAEVKLNEFLNISSKDIPGFVDKILSFFPGLKKHKCSYGVEGGFVRRLREGTYLPHIAEHLALEIQNIIGINAKFGKSIWIKDDIYWVAVEYEGEKTASLALRYSLEIVEKLLSGEEISRDEIESYLNDIKKEYEYERLGPSTRAIIEAAKERLIPVTPVEMDWSMFQLGYGKKAKMISASVTSETSLLASDVAKDKFMSKKMLMDAGVPVPVGYVVKNPDDAVRAARKIGYPVVVKPLDSHHGKGVIGCIKNDEDVRGAYIVARKYSNKVIVEEHLRGDDHRFLVVNGKMVAAARRVPPYILGDGKRTVKELVDELNNNPLRGWGHENYLTKVRIGEEEINYLKQQGFILTDIVPKGEIVYLRRNANLSTGGMAEDVTDEICEEIKMAVERAAKAIGLDVCGVDAIIKDIKRPLGNGNGGIIEINTAPGLRMHIKPTKGKGRNVGMDIINHLFPSDNGRIPVIAITGTNGKTSVVKIVEKILENKGYCVGMTTTGGIYICGKKVVEGDTTGPWSARLVLRDRDVDVAVLECARGGIWRRGLGYDRAYIGCVLNIREDHIGVDGIENLDDIFWIKSVVTEAVLPYGYSVVNAEDTYAEKLLERARGRHAVFSMKKNDIVERELRNGGTGVYTENGVIYYEAKEKKEKIMKVEEVKYALGGNLRANLENSLAAILITKLMDVDNETIKNTLSSLAPGAFSGRLNIREYKGKKIIVDYAHNPDAILKLRDLVDFIKPKETWCVIAIPGDRDDELLMEDGEAAAQVFGHILITAREKDLRGRKKEDLLQKILDGAKRVKGKDVRVMQNADNAINYALNKSKEGDAIFILMGLKSVDEIL